MSDLDEEEREGGREGERERKKIEKGKEEERKFRTPNAVIRKFEWISDNGVQAAI